MPAPVAVSAPAATAAPSSGGVQTSAGPGTITPGAPPAAPKGEATPGAPKEAPKAPEPPRRFKAKAKFDGKEQDLDLEEGEVVREIQKARHYDRTRPAFDKQVAEFNAQLEAIKADPLAFLSQRGVDLRQLAIEQQSREAELAKLSPEARRAAELEQQIEQMKSAETKRVEAEAKQAEVREHQQLVAQTRGSLEAAIKLSGRQRSGELLKNFAEVMELAVRAGEPPMSPEQLVSAVERLETTRFSSGIKRAVTDPAWRARNASVMKELAQAILPALDGQELVDFVGPANAVKLAKAQLAVFRKNPIPMVAESRQTPAAPATPRQGEESQSIFAQLDKLNGV